MSTDPDRLIPALQQHPINSGGCRRLTFHVNQTRSRPVPGAQLVLTAVAVSGTTIRTPSGSGDVSHSLHLDYFSCVSSFFIGVKVRR
ncbi:hypothetical protein [Corynebacterium variabile]|uniref:hypothetical protein n=1 Tax=Corynebacterium variabile TaxID=1727 RepID=UPI003F8D9684